jgi:hypothetical protein
MVLSSVICSLHLHNTIVIKRMTMEQTERVAHLEKWEMNTEGRKQLASMNTVINLWVV